jgi:beta-fructofuranosidase
MEVPHVLMDEQGQSWVAFSGWAKHDFSPFTEQEGGLQAVRLFSGANATRAVVTVLLPESSGLYACRVIPELGGKIVGFDVASGGIRRSGVTVPMASANRDFSKYRLE